MKTILLWDPRLPERVTLRVHDDIASALVRAGVASAANPAEAGALASGPALDGGNLLEVVLQHGDRARTGRFMIPSSVLPTVVALGLGSSVSGAAPAVAGDPNRYMFFGTRTNFPGEAPVTTAAGNNWRASLLSIGMPPWDVVSPRAHFSGFTMASSGSGTTGAPQETVTAGNGHNVDAAYWIVDGVWTPALFPGAASSASFADGAVGAWAEAAGLVLPRDRNVFFVTLYHVDAGQKTLNSYRIQHHRGERIYAAGDQPTLMNLLQDLTAPSTEAMVSGYGNSVPGHWGPDMLVGKGWNGAPVSLNTVDSIGHSRQEYYDSADARGNMGALSRWLDDARDRITHFRIGNPGASAGRELTTNALKRWSVLNEVKTLNGGADPFTVVVDQMGQNDNSTASAAAWKTGIQNLVARLRSNYPGVKIVRWPMLTRTNSSNGYLDVAGQTPSNAAQDTYPTGYRWQVVNEMLALAPGGAMGDACIDNTGYRDPAAPGVWPAPIGSWTLVEDAGTADGLTPYTSLLVSGAVAPMAGDVMVATSGSTAQIRVLGATAEGPNWRLTFTMNATSMSGPRTVYIPAGTGLVGRPVDDGLHPYGRMNQYIADRTPQSEKAKLRA